ncbi:MAG: thiamine pyrophosphate-dependent enzyme, partial [Oscillospiraceae bacterium]|nr:thiamine pyrophosphate-dependent enzyme [Oscillospiraceae bacterium]
GSLKVILPRLILESRVNPSEEWEARIRDLKAAGSVWPTEEFTPRNIIHRVNTFYDNETVVATDVGQHQMWVAQYYAFEKPRKLVTSGGLGAMGFGLGAAVGASVARGAKRAVLFTSEGSFGMNLNELATAVSQHLPVTIILLNNGVLGMVRQWQSLFFDERYSQTTLNRKTDFPALAKAFGALGYAANTLSELDDILKSVPDDAGPCLIDCKIDEDERVLPMIPAGGTIRDMLIN